MFRNDQEYRYFKVFSTQTASQLTGLFASNLWNRLVLQLCEQNQSVRHAVIALGALDPRKWRDLGSLKSWGESKRREFARHEYSKALIEMIKTIAEKTLDLRTGLIASLLFTCFEVYHCNKVFAVTQIKTMSSLLEAQVKNQNMYRQSIETIDDELFESFRELEIHDLIEDCYGSGYGKDLSPRQLATSRQTTQKMIPLQFENLRQARSGLHVLNMRQLHWQGCATYQWPWHANQETLAIMSTQRLNGPPPNEFTSSEEWFAEKDRRFEEYTVWSNAFRSLLLKARASNDAHELRRANAIWIMYLTSYLGLMTRMLDPMEFTTAKRKGWQSSLK